MPSDSTRAIEPRPDIARDIAAVARVAAVPTILEVVARTTGHRKAKTADARAKEGF